MSARLYRRRFDERTRSLGITGPQMRALVQIMRFPGINQGALADRLDVEPITTCRMVDRLEQADLVEAPPRSPGPSGMAAFPHQDGGAIAEELQTIGQGLLNESLDGIDMGRPRHRNGHAEANPPDNLNRAAGEPGGNNQTQVISHG